MTITADTASEQTVRTLNIACTLGDLTDALASVALAIASRPAVPILGGVVLEAGPDGVQVAAFDYETSVRVDLPAAVAGEGRVLIYHAALLKLVKGAAKGDPVKVWRAHPVSVTVERTTGTRPKRGVDGVTEQWMSDKATVAVAGFTIPVDGLELADYPNLPDRVTGGAEFAIDRDALLKLLDQLKVSAGKDATLPMFTGMFMRLDGGTLVAATTDRFQLGEVRIPVEVAAQGQAKWSWLLPLATLQKAAKLLPAGPVRLTLPVPGDHKQRWVGVDGGPVSATLARLDAEFPKYEKLFPADGDVTTTATLDLAAFTRAAVKAEAITDGRTGYTRVEVRGDAVEVVPTVDSDVGRLATGPQVPAEVVGAEELGAPVGLDASRLRTALGSFDGEKVQVGFTTRVRPVLFTDPAEPGYRHMLMPVRLPE